MTEAETKLRWAEIRWQRAKEDWQDSLRRVNEAKDAWQAAQDEFFNRGVPQVGKSHCGECTGCSA